MFATTIPGGAYPILTAFYAVRSAARIAYSNLSGAHDKRT